jgi:gamma-glutamylcyclotransferase (GGCT)/AIG2-like uncharacterized protein YtfP
MNYSFDYGGLVGGIVGAIPTLITVKFLSRQIKNEMKKDRVEIVMKLFNDFFNNENFQQVFELIDQDDFIKAKSDIEIIIKDGELNGVKESHFSQYFNFFNSIAILVSEKIIDQNIVIEMFKYQLERTFSHSALLKYIEEYGFHKIKLILPDILFTYGTLSDPTFRKLNPELEKCHPFLQNGSSKTLVGYRLEEVLSDQTYKAMVVGESSHVVVGTTLNIINNSNLYDLFKCLDNYEEVGTLYERRIIFLPEDKSYAWIYMKKLK